MTNAKFVDNVLKILIREGGSTSLSHLKQELRYDGWKNLGRFEDELEEHGFELIRKYKGVNVVRTDVTV